MNRSAGIPISNEHLDQHAARALGLARVCRPMIRDQVLHRLRPQHRLGAEQLIRTIDRRGIIDDQAAQQLEWLIELVSEEVERGTHRAEMWPTDPCDIDQDRTWIETRRTPEAAELAAALYDLEALLRAVMTVLDLVQVDRTLERAARSA